MKIAYFDCFSGAAGDMILGALLDAGLPLDVLQGELSKLDLHHFHLRSERVTKRGLSGTKAHVCIDEDHHGQHHRHLGDIERIIEDSGLQQSVKTKSLAIFRSLAEAEAKIHATSVENIHFHEVGAMDAIVDVIGSVIGLAALEVDTIFCSAMNVGSGTIRCAHGVLPVPAPATAELTRGKPVYSNGVVGELLTPTAAAILTTLSSGFGPIPSMVCERIGYGAGSADLETPNLLRVFIGYGEKESTGYETEVAAVIETTIDDMNPQMYDYLVEKILGMGVYDIFLLPVQMKKNRPGTLVTVICPPEQVSAVSDILLRETTTIGLRWRIDNRIKARRSIREISTEYGNIRIKIARAGSEIVNITPEYDDCKRLALEKSIPLKRVLEAARAAAIDAMKE